MMKLFIVGQKWFAATLIESLSKHAITGVATPAKEDRLYINAEEKGIPAVVSNRLTASEVPTDTDLIICAHVHCFVTSEAINSTRLGAIGYHPSLLPKHRGRDSIRWAIHMNESTTGGTVYWLDEHADKGPIAAQDWCHIRPGDTPQKLWRRDLAPMGIRLLIQVVDHLASGQRVAIPQDEVLATWEPAFHARKLGA
jgi:methionyl-tRNA formyltransferase